MMPEQTLAQRSSFYALIPILLAVWGISLALDSSFRRRGRTARGTLLLAALLAGYGLVYAGLTFAFRAPTPGRQIDLRPLWSYREAFAVRGGLRIARLGVARQIMLNVMLYVPLGCLLPLAFRKHPFLYTLLTALALSCLTEIIQYFTRLGLCETDDVLDNGLGCLIGMAMLTLGRRSLRAQTDIGTLQSKNGGLEMQKSDKGIMSVLKGMSRDIWVVLLDVIAVNAAYFLALLIRFYVNGVFRQSVAHYLTDFVEIAPFYTVACIAVFAAFRMYNGMWRYAGINDMNRIICASLATTAVQVASSFWHRMPITYYVIGAVLQFLFVVLIRFAYRFLMVEKKKIASRKLPAVNVMVVGTGEIARRAVRQLEDTVYRPACVIDSRSASDGKAMDGVPILAGTGRLEEAIGRYAVSAVIIADPSLSSEDRQGIKRICEKLGLDLRDYTGPLSNLTGRLPLTGLLEMIKSPVSIRINGQTAHYDSGMDALVSFTDRYTVTGVCAEGGYVRIDLQENRSEAFAGYEAWMQKHREETGEEVSYF